MAASVAQPRAVVQGRASLCLPSWEMGKEEWGGKLKITGKEHGSSIQRIDPSLGKRGISFFIFNEKESFSQCLFSFPSSRLI